MDDPQIDSSITEIIRLFSTFAGLNLSLLQTNRNGIMTCNKLERRAIR